VTNSKKGENTNTAGIDGRSPPQGSLEVKAGIVTPAAALRNTSFIDRVAARGVRFELVDKAQGAHLD
jgi:hypothetical protein